MNTDLLYNKMIDIVPIKIVDNLDLRTILRKKLKYYLDLLNDLNNADHPENWDEVMKRVDQLIKAINRAVESEYRGIRHSAYTSIKNQLDGYKNKKIEIKGLSFNTLKIPVHTSTFRMRKVDLENRRNLTCKDLFHVPLDLKGTVQTQRYSVPGYPCLYLAKTVYGCWEEMGRPDFGTTIISKLVSQQEFHVLDLRIPSKEKWDQDMTKCILFFPLIIASMVQVKNNKDSYKPEYLIPQLLTEWIISRNFYKEKKEEEKIIGIAYTSVHKNSDFDFPDDSIDNYAIPVLQPLAGKKYCPQLSNLFSITAPTYYDLEVLKQRPDIDLGCVDVTGDAKKKQNLKLSPFGTLADYLENKELEYIN